MYKSRQRQFAVARDRNLSQTYSNISQSSFCNRSTYQDNSHNQSSAFGKKNKIPLCNDCVNKRLIEEKQDKERRQKKIEVEEARRNNELLLSKIDEGKILKQKLMKEAERYNKQISDRKLRSIHSAKQFDSVYMLEIKEKEKEVQKLEEEVQKLRKQNEERYREELKYQYEQQLLKKQKEKQQKMKPESIKPFINSKSSRDIGIKYAEDLKKQMVEQKKNKQQQMKKKIEEEKSILEVSLDKFMNFTEFKISRKNEPNPEMFEEMKEIERKRKQEIIEKREAGEKERKEKMINLKKEVEQQTLQSYKKAEAYALILQKQAQEKKKQQQYQKNLDLRQKEPIIFTEDILNQSMHLKTCEECLQNVDQRKVCYY